MHVCHISIIKFDKWCTTVSKLQAASFHRLHKWVVIKTYISGSH